MSERVPLPAVAVVGATASGKSAVALAVAASRTGTEIVAVDAMQVYEGMDIGTAKPTQADRALVPHHGLDLADPSEDFDVTRYRAVVDGDIAGIGARGGHALLVAGTGLYLRALTDALEPPSRFPEIRAALDADPDTVGMHDRLQALDPVGALRMEPNNRRRVVRALEVCLGSGRPFSSFGPGLTAYPPTPVAQVGLRWPRPVLAARIATRFQAMLDAGLLAEVRVLAERDHPLSRTARQALGYKELLDHVEGRCSLDEAVALAVVRTRQYAVRQERWFRRDPRIRWVDCYDDPLEAAPVVARLLTATRSEPVPCT